MRIAFFGTPDVAVPYLDALVQAGHEVGVVVTQPDRPAGRGRELRPSPVKEAAQRLGVPLLQPESCRDLDFRRAVRDSGSELGVVVAYGNLLPGELLECPAQGCVNVHYSLLPQLRGAAPVQHALLNGLEETGVTVQWMSPELDVGEVIVAERVAIEPDDDCGALFRKLNEVGPSLLLRAVELIVRGEAPRMAQDDALVTWAAELSAQDCRIDWSAPAERIHHRVRACSPRPGAFTTRAGRRLKVLRTRVIGEGALLGEGQPGRLAEPGREGDPVVYAGTGAIALVMVQPEGKQPMSGRDFARGARFEPGERLGQECEEAEVPREAGGSPMDAAMQQDLASADRARTALDYDAAKPIYERLVASDPQCAEAKHGLGFVLMMGYGEFDGGLALMEEAATLAPNNQKILLDLAKSYAMLGEDDKVKPLLERVIALGADTREGQDARNQLQYYV